MQGAGIDARTFMTSTDDQLANNTPKNNVVKNIIHVIANLKFRRLLETHDLCKGLFTAINADLTARGLMMRAGTLVDATLITAPSSTKTRKSNATRKCTKRAKATSGISE